MNWLQKLRAILQQLFGSKQVNLPVLAATELAKAKANDWEYLQVFLEAYRESVQPEIPWNVLASFPEKPLILLLFSGLHGQVMNGGFIQLIQNGYGGSLFNNPFAEDIAAWGATGLAEIVKEAQAIYKANQKYLERDRNASEFSALYKEFRSFEPLENRFYAIEEDQTAIVRAYVERHISQFARVK